MNEPNEDLAQLARTKEYELRVIQEMRCKHLETMILDRENIIEENINIIEALKVDFEFNLKLLETRDSEISRLRTSLQCYEDRLSLLEGDRTALLNRLATLSERETKRIHDADEEKMIYKTKLLELRQEIENTCLVSTEERRTATHTIDALRQEVKELRDGREESLASQQRELIEIHESIARQRDEAFTYLKRSTSESTLLLETRLDELRGESARLSSELSTSRRTIADLEHAMSQKVDLVRQLTRDLEECRLVGQKAEKVIRQELDTVKAANEVDKEHMSIEISSLQTTLSRVQQAHQDEIVAHEATACSLQDTRLHKETLVSKYEEDLRQLRSELSSDRTNFHSVQQKLITSQDNCKLAGERLKTVVEEQQRIAMVLTSEEVLRRDAEALLASRSGELETCKASLAELYNYCEHLTMEKEELSIQLNNALQSYTSIKERVVGADLNACAETVDSELPPVSVPQTPESINHTAFFSMPMDINTLSDPLVQENERLSATLTSMKIEIEQLRGQVMSQSPIASANESNDESDKLRNLLTLSVDEVARLRIERRKLIELSNQLKASLQEKMTSANLPPPANKSTQVDTAFSVLPARVSEAIERTESSQLAVNSAQLRPSVHRSVVQQRYLRTDDKSDSMKRGSPKRLSPVRRKVINYAIKGEGEE